MVVRSGCLDLAHTSVTDLARMSGWNKKRVEKALHACLLSPTKDEGDRFTRYCGELRGAGERPYIELIKAGNGAVKSSYRYVGIAPLPSRTGPRGPCPQHTGAHHPTFPTDPLTRGVTGSGPESETAPLTFATDPLTSETSAGVKGSDATRQTSETDPLIPSDKESGTAPKTSATDPLAPNGVRGSMSCNKYFVVCSDQTTDEKVNEADRCFDEIVGLFPRGVGKSEFAPKARSAFDALVAAPRTRDGVGETAESGLLGLRNRLLCAVEVPVNRRLLAVLAVTVVVGGDLALVDGVAHDCSSHLPSLLVIVYHATMHIHPTITLQAKKNGPATGRRPIQGRTRAPKGLEALGLIGSRRRGGDPVTRREAPRALHPSQDIVYHWIDNVEMGRAG